MPASRAVDETRIPLAPPPQRRVVSSSRSIFANGLAEADDDAGNAAVADDEVGAEAERHHRHFRIELAQEIDEILLILRLEQPFGRAAALEPDEGRAAHSASACPRTTCGMVSDGAHFFALASQMPSASAPAHLVMSPAPMQMTMSPSAARSRSSRQSSSRSATVRTMR